MKDIDIDIDTEEDSENQYKGPVYTSCRCNLCGEVVTGYVDKINGRYPFVCNMCKSEMMKPIGTRRFDPKKEYESNRNANRRSVSLYYENTSSRITKTNDTQDAQRRYQEIKRIIESRPASHNELGMAGGRYMPISIRSITTASKAELQRWVISGRLSEVRYKIEMKRRERMSYFSDCMPADITPMKAVRF